MSQPELLKRVVSVIDSAGGAYMLTGSVVSSAQGEPRASHDIDIVVQIDPAAVAELKKAFPESEYGFDDAAALAAIGNRDMFQLWHFASGDKVDFWVLKDDPLDQSAFSRRTKWTVFGVEAFATAPEDTILLKLRWSQMSGGSSKQLGDVRGVYELQHKHLDIDYIDAWASRIGVQDDWQRIQRESNPL